MPKVFPATPFGFKWKAFLIAIFIFASVQDSFSQADLAIQGAALSPTSVPVGGNVTATSTIYNLGNVSSSSSNIGYYLSINNTFDDSDIFIGSSTGGSLAASGNTGASAYKSTYLTIPTNTAIGAYYILFKADYLNSVTESNKENNITSVSISVVPSSVDFIISSSYLYSSSVTAGTSITVEGTITNQGNIASTSSTVGYYLSTNSTLDASDIFVGSYTGSGISVGNYTSFYSTVTIPTNTAPGTYHLIFVADYLGSVNESNETNNTRSVSFSVVAPFVDLTISSPYLSAYSVAAGTTITAESYINNLGNSTATSSNIGYYLSDNSTLEASDIFIGSSTGSTLSAGNYSYRYNYLTIPANTAPGTYRILFVADYLNAISESNESNNINSVSFSVITPSVDLILSSPSLSTTTVSAGNPVNATVTIYNQGNTTATSSNIGFYLSSNNSLDTVDELIGTSNGSTLYAGGSFYRSVSLTIPSNTTPGNYFIVMAADYLNSVAETNENNNTTSLAITITAQGTTFITPASGNTNVTTCTGTVYDNGGTGNYSDGSSGSITINPGTAGNKIKLEFSSFSMESGYDYLYIYNGTSTSSPLVGYYTGSNNPGTVYATSSSGALTLYFRSDGSANYAGFEATISCVTSVPLPDLVIQNPSTSVSTITAGNSFSIGGSLRNQSTISATSSQVGYYLSSNTTVESTDVFLGYSQAYALSGGGSSSLYGNLTIPLNTAAGSYYIIYAADYTNTVTEDNETNNTASVAITVSEPSIDLVILSAFPSSNTLTTGTSFTLSSFIANQGSSTSPSSNVGYYLSANSTFESTDILLGYTSGGTLTAGSSAQKISTISLPATTTAGSYYILFIADYSGVVTETNETNNLRTAAVTVSSPNTIDLDITAKTLANTTVIPGGTVSGTVTVKNNGNYTSPQSSVSFYLSANNTLEATDIPLGSVQTEGTLAAGASATLSSILTIPAATALGNYFILFKTDAENHIAESDETNGFTFLAITVATTSNLADLIVQTPTVSATSAIVGTAVTVTANIKNQGTVAASSSSVGYYLSANTTFESTDVALGSSSGGSLAINATAAKTASFTIPVGTAAGNYFILYVADHNSAVSESNETNNIVSVALAVIAPVVDLTIHNAALTSTSVLSGNSITASASITNSGNVASTSSAVGYYISGDTILDASDVSLGTSTGGNLAAGASASKNAAVTIPANTAAGNYFILFVADPANTVTESNETNNLASLAISVSTPTIDLVMQAVTASPSEVQAGGSVYLSGSISNIGTVAASSSTVGYYLSTNKTFESTDIALGSSTGGTLAAGTAVLKTTSVTIPASTAKGDYYILFVADHDKAVAEVNETNNVTAALVKVSTTSSGIQKPDLVVQRPVVTEQFIIPGESVTVSATIANIGHTSAPAGKVSYYLSVNKTYESTDVLLGEKNLDMLASGASVNLSNSLIIPANTARSAYFILVSVDAANAIDELDEGNNTDSVGVEVTAPNALRDLADLHSLNVWPVPTSEKLNIEAVNFKAGEKSAVLTLYSAIGVKVLTRKANIYDNELQTSLDVQGLAAGIYFVYIQVGDSLAVRKIVVKK